MNIKKKSVERQAVQPHSLGIGACIYPPQESKNGLLDCTRNTAAHPPVAAGGTLKASRPILSFDFASAVNWHDVINAAKNKDNISADTETDNGAREDKLEVLVQAIVERGQEILPLLGQLREKAEHDPVLSELVDIIQARLSLGINAVCTLAPREMEVLEMAASGESNPRIAQMLHLHTITVAQTLSRAYRKLGAKNRSDAVRKWMLLRGMRG